MESDDFFDWFDLGVEKGWISKAFCYSHDSIDMTDDEVEEYDQYEEMPCIAAVRVWGKSKVF